MWKLALTLGALLARSVTCLQIGFIPKVAFIPHGSNATKIAFNGSCFACSCLANQQNYSGFNCFTTDKTCVMFPTYAMSYNLNATMNATFYFFHLPTIVGSNLQTSSSPTTAIPTTQRMVYRNLTSSSDVIVAIWNTTAGGNSRVATVGTSNGQYPSVNEGPASVLDSNLNTKYNSYGSANVSTNTKTLVAGVGTGFYVTMAVGTCVVTGVQFATANDAAERDPLTMTLEGSKIVNTSLLSLGSSWTLIFTGPTGISSVSDPGRKVYAVRQNFTNTARFSSYRAIMTSQRGNATNLQYSELRLLGYT